MEEKFALAALAALAQPTRLTVYRLLASRLPDGMGQTRIAAECGTPRNTMSVHLAVLVTAGLVEAERHGRDVTYRACIGAARAAFAFVIGEDEAEPG